MIQINATTHTDSGITISTGSVLDVYPTFQLPKKVYDEEGNFESITYSISYAVRLFKDLATYKKENSIPLFVGQMLEYNVSYIDNDVDIQGLTDINSILEILVNHIENGNDQYSGVGVGKTAIVYP